MNQEEEVQKLRIGSEVEERRRARYEEACSTVPLGYLSAYDICRLWDGGNLKNWKDSPATRARALVEEHGLSLMELGQGHWVVAHTVTGAA